jgi:hypothetical protein
MEPSRPSFEIKVTLDQTQGGGPLVEIEKMVKHRDRDRGVREGLEEYARLGPQAREHPDQR